jgi:hypothetical protein
MIGLISSLSLINLGKSQFANTNIILSIFIIYISLVQLAEYFIWSDEECKTGANKLGTSILPLLIKFQPVILGFLLYRSIKSANIISNQLFILINIVYIIYSTFIYIDFIKAKKLCTYKNTAGHLTWKWNTNITASLLYMIMMIFNVLNYIQNANIKRTILWIGLTLLFSKYIAPQNIGELWCFYSTSTPLIVLLLQYIN